MNKIKFMIIFLISSPALSADPLKNSISMSSSAMHAQSKRIEVIAENIANSNTTSVRPGSEPYKRKIIIFKNQKNNKLSKVKMLKIAHDNSNFIKKYEPYHPAADNSGYVLYPNVNTIIESADAREAKRSYDANLSVIEISRNLISKTLDSLR